MFINKIKLLISFLIDLIINGTYNKYLNYFKIEKKMVWNITKYFLVALYNCL
jgi:hypothetical protein